MPPTIADAWLAYENENYEGAAELWQMLLLEATSEAERRKLELGFGYTLVALKRFGEARALYSSLYAETDASIYLHQLGMVEREAGAYDEALKVFELEREHLTESDPLRRAGNLYELGFVHSLLGRKKQAQAHAEACLELALQTEDLVMHGCAYRLLGDLKRSDHREASNRFYDLAHEVFEQAGDARACEELFARRREVS